jgi:beta-glucosidase
MDTDLLKSQFPRDFIWGAATAAFQIEGGRDADGKGRSIWDSFCENPANTADGSSGEIACDHYNRLEEDLDLIESLGLNAYRFSMSWPRVQAKGQGEWNEAGFAFYEKLIEGLVSRGIQAHLTLYHWDLPQALQDVGGWANRDTCHAFVKYACEVERRFGHLLASITTHNEPWVVAFLGHEQGIFAPGLRSRKIAFQVAHHLLLSHGMALRAMREQGCKTPLGIVLNQSPIYPATDSAADVFKAQIDDGLIVRWYMDALLHGSYPEDVIQFIGADAPDVEPTDMAQIKQPLDFIGINYYTRNYASTGNPWDVHASGNDVTDMGWEVYPAGITELLCRLHQDYSLPQILITENGAAYKDELIQGRVHDDKRVSYLREHIRAVKVAMDQGVNVGGYFAWSLLDNFEWASGYTKRFGIVYVDYSTQKRYLKDSAFWYQHFLCGVARGQYQSEKDLQTV